jgi:hypothetical protein
MELKCPECGAAIAEADVNTKAGIAVCRACDKMFVVTRRGEEFVAAPADTVPPREEAAAEETAQRPPGFTTSEADGVLTISFPPKGFGQGWRLLSVAVFVLVFAAVLARHVLVHRPAAFFMFMAGAVLLGATALVLLVGGFYLTFGEGTVMLSPAEAVFRRRLFGLSWIERADLGDVARVQPFRMRQRTRIELFTCGLVMGARRCKFFCDLGDAEMFEVADIVNGFLKRVRAPDFTRALDAEHGADDEEEEERASRKDAKTQR